MFILWQRLLVSLKTSTWCQEWLSICGLLATAIFSVNQANSLFYFYARRNQDGGTCRFTDPNFDWHSPDAPQAFKKFKAWCELYFSGPLKEKSEEEQISYLLIWSGDDGIELVSTWALSSEEKKKLDTYWTRFESFLSPKSNFRLLRYKLGTLKQQPGESVDSFVKKIRIPVEECRFTMMSSSSMLLFLDLTPSVHKPNSWTRMPLSHLIPLWILPRPKRQQIIKLKKFHLVPQLTLTR